MDRSQNQIINITYGERNIPVSFSLKPNCEALVFHMEYVTDKNNLMMPDNSLWLLQSMSRQY